MMREITVRKFSVVVVIDSLVLMSFDISEYILKYPIEFILCHICHLPLSLGWWVGVCGFGKNAELYFIKFSFISSISSKIFLDFLVKIMYTIYSKGGD